MQIGSFYRARKGAALTEYGILVGLVAVVAITSVVALGGKVRDVFSASSDAIEIGAVSEPAAPPTSFVNPFTDAAESAIAVGYTGVRAQVQASDMDVEIPAGLVEGDMMLAFVSHGGALTAPDGWSSAASLAIPSGNRTLTVLSKEFVDSDGTLLSLTQSSTGTFLAQVYGLVGGHGIITAVGAARDASSNDRNHAVPGALVMQDDTLLVAALVEDYMLTSGSTSVTFEDGWTQTTPVSTPANRLAVAWKSVPDGGTVVDQAEVTIGHSGPYSWAATMLQIR